MTKLRNDIIGELRKEVIGPAQRYPYVNSESGEEVLLDFVHGSPLKRYGASILYPQNSIVTMDFEDSGTKREELQDQDGEEEDFSEEKTGKIEGNIRKRKSEEASDLDDPITLANALKPSSLGFSCRLHKEFERIIVKISGGIYRRGEGDFPQYTLNDSGKPQINENAARNGYWIRTSVSHELSLTLHDIPDKRKHKTFNLTTGGDDHWIQLRVDNRSGKTEEEINSYFLTFTLVNIKEQTSRYPSDEDCFFQATMKLSGDNFIPFEEKISEDSEVNMLNLLYRKKRSYAISHGTGVEWDNSEKPSWIRTTGMPEYEIPLVEPTVEVELSMYTMSDKGSWTETLSALDSMADTYEKWIQNIENEVSQLHQKYRQAAINNISKCKESLKRIRKGIILLKNEQNTDAIKAFKYMNYAMLWQQQRSKISQRRWIRKGRSLTLQEYSMDNLEDFSKKEGKGKWRPFQLAFILLNLESVIDPKSPEREIVELIWFPTGGGKTEAYLGLAAFTIFYKRLTQGEELGQDGTTVLMRYTLRLLTTQQFERACSLIVVCNLIVQEEIDDFGFDPAPVSIGLWVGGSNTPNKNTDAEYQFNQLLRNKNSHYNFIVLKCPCCGSQIGKLDENQVTAKKVVTGIYKADSGKIFFSCENSSCETFEQVLPVYVVDEVIYENTPDLILATVDKFAMLPFKEQTSRLFGFRSDGQKTWRVRPPELIIQDELHLISGPLGTMVGHYEAMVQSLCRNYTGPGSDFIPENHEDYEAPKIVASTATISRAEKQVRSLYSRNKLHIFPSQGLEFGNTWFSREVSPNVKPGRRYVGLCPTGYPSAQTAIVRLYASVLQQIKNLSDEHQLSDIDYYWTLVGYFNSIRELGGAVNLVSADIQERIKNIYRRDLRRHRRKNIFPVELTSRIDSTSIPEYLKLLEVSKVQEKESLNDEERENQYAKDLCLATNMIATGVDISRFGIMVVHGQPKTTAEYIQASSRVGRDHRGPGLVFTLYNGNKARDKSQFEQFQSFHARIYGSVEPTSVTPFSVITRERALYAVFTGLCRHLSSTGLRKSPSLVNTDFIKVSSFVKEIIMERVRNVAPEELMETEKQLDNFIKTWKERNYPEYGDAMNYRANKENIIPLLYSKMAPLSNSEIQAISTSAPTSMRGVDSESRIKVI